MNNKMKSAFSINIERKYRSFRLAVWFVLAGAMFMGLSLASIVSFPKVILPSSPAKFDRDASSTLAELNRFGLLNNVSQEDIELLLEYQKETGQSLTHALRDPRWLKVLGLSSKKFKSTWYAANPFDLLPPDLQMAIKQKKLPMNSNEELRRWLKKNDVSKNWVQALNAALKETTVANLVRASKGKRPYVKNGEFLKPIVFDRGEGQLEVKDGHIAIDPRIIPMNSELLAIVRVKGQDRLIRVKAADIGQAIRGHHVDLPIHMKPRKNARFSPTIVFPKEYIRNPTITIIGPARLLNRDQKA